MKEGVRIKVEYRSSLRSKTLIRNALLDLLEEKPFDKITITDIVKKANINRGTFYLHYHDIQDVLNQIVVGVVDELMYELGKIPDSTMKDSPSIIFKTISSFLMRDIVFYKKLAMLDSSGFFITDMNRKATSFILGKLDDVSLPDRNEMIIALNCIVAGSASIYRDIVSGKIKVELDKASLYLGQLVDTQMAIYKERALLAEEIAE